MNVIEVVTETTLYLQGVPEVEDFTRVGSSTIPGCEPNDVDFLVLLKSPGPKVPTGDAKVDAPHPFDHMMYIVETFKKDRWSRCSGEYDDQDETWAALRKGYANLIVTTSPEWRDRCEQANNVCRLLHITDKVQRVAVFRMLRDHMSVECARNIIDAGTI